MALTQEQKKQFKSIGHHLKPVLIVADNGLTEGVLAELERALSDHELIKVQFRITERDDRRALIDELCRNGSCELIQTIGKMAGISVPAHARCLIAPLNGVGRSGRCPMKN